MKKILLFIETGGAGGAEKVVLETAKLLKSLNIEVIVATLREGWLTESIKELGIKNIVLKSPKKLDFSLIYKIKKIIQEENITLVHSHLLDSNFYCSIACYLAKVPHLASEHGDVHHINPKKLTRLKINLLNLSPTKLTAVSKFTADKLHQLGFKKDIIILNNPLGILLRSTEIEKAKLKEKLIIKNSDFVWLNIANLRPVKDQITLIKGFGIALQKNKNQKLFIIGEGEEKKSLDRIIKSLNLNEHIKLLGLKNDVYKYLEIANGSILTSKSEALPMSILEAGAYNLITIASAVGGIPEIIKENENGFLFNSGDFQELAKKINYCIDNKDKLSPLSTALNKYILEHFSLDTFKNNLLKLYGYSSEPENKPWSLGPIN